MRKNSLNEEIFNQIRLMNFDRKLTLMEQTFKNVNIKGTIYNAKKDGGGLCYNCKVKLYYNNLTYGTRENNIEYSENAINSFVRETPLAEKQTYLGGFDFNIELEPGPYAIVFNGGESLNDYTNVYFDITNSGTYNLGSLTLRPRITELPEYSKTKFKNKKSEQKYNQWLGAVEKYNKLIDDNWSNRSYNYTFPNPLDDITYERGGRLGPSQIQDTYITPVLKSINALESEINRGKEHLKYAKKYVSSASNIKPLDVTKNFGTQEGYNVMHSLTYKENWEATTTWRYWYNNDGKWLDKVGYHYTEEEIKQYQKESKKSLDTKIKQYVHAYHEYAPYVALLLYFTGVGTPLAVGIEIADSILYYQYDDKPYMAGLTFLFALTGADEIFGGPVARKAALEWAERYFSKKITNKLGKEAIENMIANTTKTEIAKRAAIAFLKFLGGLFSLMKTSVKALMYVMKRLWAIVDRLPAPLKFLIHTLKSMAVLVGGVTWTWDKIAYWIGLCNDTPFAEAYDKWDSKDHWFITNYTLKYVVGYMGALQGSTDSCDEIKAKQIVAQVRAMMSDDEKQKEYTLRMLETRTAEQQAELDEINKLYIKSYEEHKKSIEEGNKQLQNKSDQEMNDTQSKFNNYHDTLDVFLLRDFTDIKKEAEKLQ